MRNRDEPLEPGDELVDGDGRYRVVRVGAGAEPAGAWARLGGVRRVRCAYPTSQTRAADAGGSRYQTRIRRPLNW